MKIPFFTLSRQNKNIGKNIKKLISDVIDSGIYSDGPKIKEFELKWSEINKVKHTIFTSSGTSALEIAIKCLNSKEKFIVPTNTFFASASQVPAKNGIEFIDSDQSGNMDISKISNLQTQPIIGVNLYGQPLNIDALFSKRNKKYIILDLCQSHFSTYKGKSCASYVNISTFSFYTTKVISGAGESGCICTDNDNFADYAKSLRNHGRVIDGYNHKYISGNLRGDEIQAAILLEKLNQKDEIVMSRLESVRQYRHNFIGNKFIRLLPDIRNAMTVNYVMPIYVNNREKIIDKLSKQSISTMIHYPVPLHLQPAFTKFYNKNCKNAESQCLTELSLPLFYGITPTEIDYVSEQVIKAVNENL